MHWKLPTEVKSVQAGWLVGRAKATDAMQEADPVEHCDVTLRPRIRYIRLVGERSHPIPSKHLVQARIRIKDQDKDQGYSTRFACERSHPILSQHLVQAWSPPPPS